MADNTMMIQTLQPLNWPAAPLLELVDGNVHRGVGRQCESHGLKPTCVGTTHRQRDRLKLVLCGLSVILSELPSTTAFHQTAEEPVLRLRTSRSLQVEFQDEVPLGLSPRYPWQGHAVITDPPGDHIGSFAPSSISNSIEEGTQDRNNSSEATTPLATLTPSQTLDKTWNDTNGHPPSWPKNATVARKPTSNLNDQTPDNSTISWLLALVILAVLTVLLMLVLAALCTLKGGSCSVLNKSCRISAWLVWGVHHTGDGERDKKRRPTLIEPLPSSTTFPHYVECDGVLRITGILPPDNPKQLQQESQQQQNLKPLRQQPQQQQKCNNALFSSIECHMPALTSISETSGSMSEATDHASIESHVMTSTKHGLRREKAVSSPTTHFDVSLLNCCSAILEQSKPQPTDSDRDVEFSPSTDPCLVPPIPRSPSSSFQAVRECDCDCDDRLLERRMKDQDSLCASCLPFENSTPGWKVPKCGIFADSVSLRDGPVGDIKQVVANEDYKSSTFCVLTQDQRCHSLRSEDTRNVLMSCNPSTAVQGNQCKSQRMDELLSAHTEEMIQSKSVMFPAEGSSQIQDIEKTPHLLQQSKADCSFHCQHGFLNLHLCDDDKVERLSCGPLQELNSLSSVSSWSPPLAFVDLEKSRCEGSLDGDHASNGGSDWSEISSSTFLRDRLKRARATVASSSACYNQPDTDNNNNNNNNNHNEESKRTLSVFPWSRWRKSKERERDLDQDHVITRMEL